MPFHLSFLDESWTALMEHAANPAEPWVVAGEHKVMKAIVCVATTPTPARHTAGFTCQLLPREVLLFFSHNEPECIDFALEASIVGTYHTWTLSLSGNKLGLIRERVPPPVRGVVRGLWATWRSYTTAPHVKWAIKCVATYVGVPTQTEDDVRLKVRIVAQREASVGIVNNVAIRTKPPAIRPKDRPMELEVHCMVPL